MPALLCIRLPTAPATLPSLLHLYLPACLGYARDATTPRHYLAAFDHFIPFLTTSSFLSTRLTTLPTWVPAAWDCDMTPYLYHRTAAYIPYFHYVVLRTDIAFPWFGLDYAPACLATAPFLHYLPSLSCHAPRSVRPLFAVVAYTMPTMPPAARSALLTVPGPAFAAYLAVPPHRAFSPTYSLPLL